MAVSLLALLCPARSDAQNVDVNFLSRSSPTPAFVAPEPARYNLKFGKLNARFRASMQAEYIDNINLSDKNREFDFSLNPNMQVGFVYPLTQAQLMELNIGFGYRYFLNHPGISSYGVDPKTRLDYKITLFKDIEVRFYDSFSILTDPTSRADISGGKGLIDFQRLNNTAGILLNWQPVEAWRFSVGYSYGISRSLSDQFQELDQDTHSYSSAIYYTVSPRMTVGINGTIARTYYSTHFQNDATSYSLGPVLIYKPSEFISVSAFVGYSLFQFGQNGVVTDTSEFRGITGNIAILHKMNRFMTEDLQYSQGRDLGVGSNFNETMVTQYGLSLRVSKDVNVRTSLTYERLHGSGAAGEDAQRFLAYVGTGLKLSKYWGLGLGYAFALKDSEIAGRNYVQNRFTLDVNREF